MPSISENIGLATCGIMEDFQNGNDLTTLNL